MINILKLKIAHSVKRFFVDIFNIRAGLYVKQAPSKKDAPHG